MHYHPWFESPDTKDMFTEVDAALKTSNYGDHHIKLIRGTYTPET